MDRVNSCYQNTKLPRNLKYKRKLLHSKLDKGNPNLKRTEKEGFQPSVILMTLISKTRTPNHLDTSPRYSSG